METVLCNAILFRSYTFLIGTERRNAAILTTPLERLTRDKASYIIIPKPLRAAEFRVMASQLQPREHLKATLPNANSHLGADALSNGDVRARVCNCTNTCSVR